LVAKGKAALLPRPPETTPNSPPRPMGHPGHLGHLPGLPVLFRVLPCSSQPYADLGTTASRHACISARVHQGMEIGIGLGKRRAGREPGKQTNPSQQTNATKPNQRRISDATTTQQRHNGKAVLRRPGPGHRRRLNRIGGVRAGHRTGRTIRGRPAEGARRPRAGADGNRWAANRQRWPGASALIRK